MIFPSPSGFFSSVMILAVVHLVTFGLLGITYLAATMGELDSVNPVTNIPETLLPLVNILGFPGWWAAGALGYTAESKLGLSVLAVVCLLNSILWGCGLRAIWLVSRRRLRLFRGDSI